MGNENQLETAVISAAEKPLLENASLMASYFALNGSSFWSLFAVEVASELPGAKTKVALACFEAGARDISHARVSEPRTMLENNTVELDGHRELLMVLPLFILAFINK